MRKFPTYHALGLIIYCHPRRRLTCPHVNQSAGPPSWGSADFLSLVPTTAATGGPKSTIVTRPHFWPASCPRGSMDQISITLTSAPNEWRQLHGVGDGTVPLIEPAVWLQRVTVEVIVTFAPTRCLSAAFVLASSECRRERCHAKSLCRNDA